MLSREDSRRLAELERQLERDDPEFCARMSGGFARRRPRHRAPLSLIFTAAVIWMAAVALGVLGWWLAAALTALCATSVVAAIVYRLRKRVGPSVNTDKTDGTSEVASPWGSLPGAGGSWGSTSTPGAGSPWGSGNAPGAASAPGASSAWGGGNAPEIGHERDGGSAPGGGSQRDGGDTKESGTPTE